jgi:DNA-binding PucR family transcriptional regulator
MNSLHPGLTKLFEARDAHVWLQTLECYFDLGCDARGAAKLLFINRGTLYHRLHRIEEIAGVDLSSGRDRLALHLGLKLARLAGLLDTPSIA